MRTEVLKVLNLNNFFNISKSNDKIITYKYKEASKILLHNIRTRWLQFLYTKTNHHFPVYLNKPNKMVIKNQPCGYIHQIVPTLDKEDLIECKLEDMSTKTTSELCFNMIVPTQDAMQYFMQWQRYRKYWWSSVTTTPSLFSLSDIKHADNSANVDVLANFKWGSKIVEAVAIDTDSESSYLTCKMSFENALFTLLLDGLNNSTEEEYLRLHNKMAPYKIALAIENDDCTLFASLKELGALMMHKLETRNISTISPNVELPLELQLRENFQIGVTYTAIINENTLSNGIFHLLNSSTMLKEQIHLADFENYATLLCGK